jgi:HEAT repeat protein
VQGRNGRTVPDARIERLILALDVEGEREPRRAIAKLLGLGRPARLALRDALRQSPRVRVRRWAVDALGQSRDRSALPDIRGAFRDPHMSVRLHAVSAIKRFGSARLGQALIPLLRDPSGGIRVNVVDALALLAVPGCDRALLSMTRDEKWYVRLAALRALAARSALSPAIRKRLASDAHASVRRAASGDAARAQAVPGRSKRRRSERTLPA